MNTNNTALFFQVPQYTLALNLSNNDRMVLSVLNDRNNLSKSNNLTHNGRICLFYTRKAIAETVGLCEKTVIKAIKRLKSYGLIEEIRQGQGKANIIYLIPQNNSETLENSKNCNNSTPKTVNNSVAELEKVQRNNNNLNNNDSNNNKNNKVINDDISTPKSDNQTSKDLNNIVIDENIEKFKVKWQEVKNQSLTLGKSETHILTKLIEKHSIETVMTAVTNISQSNYLLSNCTLYDFFKNFISILNQKYINKPKNSPKTAENGKVGERPTPTETKADRGEFIGEITKKMQEILKTKEEISNISYNTWFSELVFKGYTKVVEIICPNEMTREIIGTRYMALIRSVLNDYNLTLPITLA